MDEQTIARNTLARLFPIQLDSRWTNPPGATLAEKLSYLLNTEWINTPAGRRVRELLEIARQRKAQGIKPHE